MIQELALTLICFGVTDAVGASQSQTYASIGGQTGLATTTHYSRERTGDRLTVRVQNERVSIRGPESLRPAMSGSGQDGWRELTEVGITDNEITGRISYNWVNRPHVEIDRTTGEVRISQGNVLSGRSSFVGECERVETDRPRF